MQIKLINPTEFSHWDQQVAELGNATIFHTAAWAKVLSESYGYRPVYVGAFQDGQLAACLPLMDVRSIVTGRRGVSLPFTDECPPLGGPPEKFDAVWCRAIEYGREAKWKYVEIRGEYEYYHGAPEYSRYLTHILSLSGNALSIGDKFRSSTTRNINRAIRSGVEIKKSYSMDSVKTFYRLHCITRKKQGLPPQPITFYRKVYEHIISKKMGFVLLAVFKNLIIAAAVFFKFGGQMLYKYGASCMNYQRLRPNNLVIWEAIKIAINSGCSYFDFGRTELENTGLRQFKCGWSVSENTLRYFLFNLKAEKFCAMAAKPASSHPIFQQMPLPLLKLSGRLLYRHLG